MARSDEEVLGKEQALAAADQGMDRATLRIGSVCAILGAVLAAVFSILEPRVNSADPILDQLRVVTESDGWIFHHLGTLLFTLLITAALYVVSRTLVGRDVEVWRHVAVGSLLVSTPVAFITVGLDGYATGAAADAAAAGGNGGLAAGTTLVYAVWGVFMLETIMYLGVTPILFGVAVRRSRVYPAAFGWPAILAGLLSLTAGFLGTATGPSATFDVLFTISTGLLTLWLLAIGVRLWRRAPTAAPPA